jgi:hypothetical protein
MVHAVRHPASHFLFRQENSKSTHQAPSPDDMILGNSDSLVLVSQRIADAWLIAPHLPTSHLTSPLCPMSPFSTASSL